MENEEVIRKQMEETRTSLTEKVECIENKIAQTVNEATSAVSETVGTIKDSVQETVCAVKDTVRDTVSTVKSTVHDGVTTVKDLFNVKAHVETHPWVCFGGAVATGYMLDCLLIPSKTDVAMPTATVSQAAALSSSPTGMTSRRAHHNGGHNGGQRAPAREKRHHEPSFVQGLMQQFGPEINRIKGLALGTLFGTIREMISQSLPPHVGQQLKQVIDSATEKLGGERMPESDWAAARSTSGADSDDEATERSRSREYPSMQRRM